MGSPRGGIPRGGGLRGMPIGGGGLLRLKKLLAISSGGAGKAEKLKFVDFKIQILVSQKSICQIRIPVF